jgi:hypothetical protein
VIVLFTIRASERKARELNPHSRREPALAERSGEPISGYLPPAVDPPGVEPGSPPRQGGALPLGDEPERRPPDPSRTGRRQWTAGESNPDLLVASQASSRWTSGPSFRTHSSGPPENRTRSTSLPRRHAAVAPADHRTNRKHEGPPESRTRSPSLQKRDAPGTPTDHRPDPRTNQSSRRESNPRFLFVREVSSPLDHGTSQSLGLILLPVARVGFEPTDIRLSA